MIYGYIGSRRLLIISFFILFSLLVIIYEWLYNSSPLPKLILNYSSVLCSGLLVVGYRLIRSNVRDKSKRLKEEGLKIAVDVDGVLANQIDGTLEYENSLRVDRWKIKICEKQASKSLCPA